MWSLIRTEGRCYEPSFIKGFGMIKMTRHVLLEFMQAVEISINVHGINFTYHILYPTLSSKSVANMILL